VSIIRTRPLSLTFPLPPAGKNYGTVLIPEGLVDSIPELRLLISEIDGVFAECGNAPLDASALRSKLTMWSRALLDSLPDFMQSALLLSRGSDTHFQASLVETVVCLV
jgi:hypothetical protein